MLFELGPLGVHQWLSFHCSGFMKGERTTLLVDMQLWEARCEMSLHCMQ